MTERTPEETLDVIAEVRRQINLLVLKNLAEIPDSGMPRLEFLISAIEKHSNDMRDSIRDMMIRGFKVVGTDKAVISINYDKKELTIG